MFAIMVRERGADREVELCRVGSHPEALVLALQKKFLTVENRSQGKKMAVRRYERVYSKEIHDGNG